MLAHTLANSTPAKLYPAGVQKDKHDSMVMLLTSVKDATRRVREEVESLMKIGNISLNFSLPTRI